MQLTGYSQRQTKFRKTITIALCVIAVALVLQGCKRTPGDTSAAAELPAMNFAPHNIPTDNCAEQGLFTADCSGFMAEGAGKAKNVILLIGDGMGFNQVFAGRVYVNGPDKPLLWEQLPHRGALKTCAVGEITDSAAAGTALSTGNKTQKKALAMIREPELKQLDNITDLIHDRKSVGIVSTTKIWDATPAAFSAHVPYREMDKEIACEIITQTEPEVVLGGGADAFKAKNECEGSSDDENAIDLAKKSGYTFVSTAADLANVNTDATKKILGLFAGGSMHFEVSRKSKSTEPHLSEMARVALDILDNDPRGFFLMIEGARIDHAGHMMSEKKLAGEMAEFNKTIELVFEWAKNHPDTLIVITADHETGGSKIVPKNYKKGDLLKIKWTPNPPTYAYAYHSNQRVPIFGKGPNAAAIKDRMDNTETFCVIKNAFGDLPQKTTMR